MTCWPAPACLAILLGIAPAAAASRTDFLATTFTRIPATPEELRFGGAPIKLDLPALRRAQPYAQACSLPKAPLFHPFVLDSAHLRQHHLAGPQVTFNIQFPPDFLEALPASLGAKLAELHLGADQVDLFCVVQNQPWEGVPLLFRPHYWTDPDAPNEGLYHESRRVEMGLFDAPPAIHFKNRAANAFFATPVTVSSPRYGKDGKLVPVHGLVRAYPDAPATEVVGLDPRRSVWFWTLCRMPQGRAAATLQVLLNDEDQARAAELAQNANNLRQCLQLLDGGDPRFTLPALAIPLHDLARPILMPPATRDYAFALGEASGILTIRGTGLTGATAVTLGGVPMTITKVVDDSTLLVGVPSSAAAGGDLRVTTPLGMSLLATPPSAASSSSSSSPPVLRPVALGLWREGPNHTLTVPASGFGHLTQRQLACAPGQVLVGEAVIDATQLTGGGASLTIHFFNSKGDPIDHRQEPDEPAAVEAGAWQRQAIRAQAPEGASWVKFGITAGGGPGEAVTFQAVTFARIPMLEAPPDWKPFGQTGPLLWAGAPEHTLTIPASGTAGRYPPKQACQAGDLFLGTCKVDTTHLTKGQARIGIQFSAEDGTVLGYGSALGQGRPAEATPGASMRLWVRGQVPQGAARVMFYTQVQNANPGDTVTFSQVSFGSSASILDWGPLCNNYRQVRHSVTANQATHALPGI